MDIKDFRREREKLEEEIAQSIREQLTQFKKRSGYYPYSISVNTTAIPTLAGPMDFSVSSVVLEFHI